MLPIKKYLLDSNIYGEMVVDPELDSVVRSYESCKRLVLVYGVNEIVRKELRAAPKGEKAGMKKLRINLLSLYDAFVGEHVLSIIDEHRRLMEEYYKAYREFGGSKQKDVVFNDFLLVACASAKGMDVVVSDDEKTLLTENAVRAYRFVNGLAKLRTPEFIGYEKFKSVLKSCASRSGASNEFVGSPDKFRVFLVFLNLLYQLLNFSFHALKSYLFIYKPFGKNVSSVKGVFWALLAN